MSVLLLPLPTWRAGVGGRGDDFTRRPEPLFPAIRAHSGSPESGLVGLHTSVSLSGVAPGAPPPNSCQLSIRRASGHLRAPQALRSDPFPTLEGARKGTAPGQQPDTPGLGPFAACPAAQSGVLLTSWVWRAAAPRRGLGEAAGFGPGWDIFW